MLQHRDSIPRPSDSDLQAWAVCHPYISLSAAVFRRSGGHQLLGGLAAAAGKYQHQNFERNKLECQPYLQICALDNSLTLRQRDNYTTALSENVAILLAFKAVSGCHSCRVRPALKMTLEYKISKMFKKYFPNSLAKDKRRFQKYVFNLRIKIVVFSQFQLKFRQMRIV